MEDPPEIAGAVNLLELAKVEMAATRDDPARGAEAIRLLTLLGRDEIARQVWEIIEKTGLRIHQHEEVKATRRADDGLFDVVTGKGRYRSRFVEKSLETRVQDRVVSSLVFEIDENPMDLKVETGTPATATADRWLLPAHITFPLSSIARVGAHRGAVWNCVRSTPSAARESIFGVATSPP